MTLIISQIESIRPESGNASSYFAAHNPIIIPVVRQDAMIVAIADGGGGTASTLTLVSLPSEAAMGQKVYVWTLGNVGSGVYTITNISGSDVTIDMPFVATSTGIMNLSEGRSGYLVKADVYRNDPITAAQTYIGSSKFRPPSDCNPNNKLSIQVDRYAREVLNTNDDWTCESSTNQGDNNLSAILEISLTEFWIMSSESEAGSVVIGVINAAMQPGHRYFHEPTGVWYDYGSNMAEYMPEIGGQDLALFLSTPRKLRCWNSLPFSIEFLSSVYTPVQLTRHEDMLDVNGSVVASHSEILSSSTDVMNRVNRVGLRGLSPAFLPGYASNTDSVDVTIQDYAGDAITETINVRVNHCIPRAPVYLKALDPAGGWRYFCFGTKNVKGITTTVGSTFVKWWKDIAFQNSDIEVSSKSSSPEITIGADMIDGFDTEIIDIILSSVKVMMLTNPLSWNIDGDGGHHAGPLWQTVRPKPGTYKTRNNPSPFNSVEFAIELIHTNLQVQ